VKFIYKKKIFKKNKQLVKWKVLLSRMLQYWKFKLIESKTKLKGSGMTQMTVLIC